MPAAFGVVKRVEPRPVERPRSVERPRPVERLATTGANA